MQFRLPDLGEGTTEAELIRWLVKPGDSVKLDQPVAEVQTDKVLVELPSPVAGIMRTLLVAEGVVAPVGTVLFEIDEAGSEAGAPKQVNGRAHREEAAPVGASANGLVGQAAGADGWSPVADNSVRKAIATPAIRRMARERGIDLTVVHGSGPAGRVLESDLDQYSAGTTVPIAPAEAGPAEAGPAIAAAARPSSPMPGEDDGVEEERIPLRGLRRRIAENMVLSTSTIPHVSSMVEVEVSGLVALRKSAVPAAEAKGVKLSYLPYVVKALVQALREFPYVNGSIDNDSQEIVVKRNYHIGIAVATPDGLLVPVVHHADRLTVLEIAAEITRLTEGARARTLGMQDLRGSTFTVSNFGSVGGFFATPIINPGEAAILGLGRIVDRPWVVDGRVEPRPILPLSFTADHRLIDGELAMQFLNSLISLLEQPGRLLLDMR
jgi:pyruvate dehydrogenase E2 component (dihydrolipoamide acetyltransferase)